MVMLPDFTFGVAVMVISFLPLETDTPFTVIFCISTSGVDDWKVVVNCVLLGIEILVSFT